MSLNYLTDTTLLESAEWFVARVRCGMDSMYPSFELLAGFKYSDLNPSSPKGHALIESCVRKYGDQIVVLKRVGFDVSVIVSMNEEG